MCTDCRSLTFSAKNVESLVARKQSKTSTPSAQGIKNMWTRFALLSVSALVAAWLQDMNADATGGVQTAESHLIETETEMVEARKKIKEDADAASGASQLPEMVLHLSHAAL